MIPSIFPGAQQKMLRTVTSVERYQSIVKDWKDKPAEETGIFEKMNDTVDALHRCIHGFSVTMYL